MNLFNDILAEKGQNLILDITNYFDTFRAEVDVEYAKAQLNEQQKSDYNSFIQSINENEKSTIEFFNFYGKKCIENLVNCLYKYKFLSELKSDDENKEIFKSILVKSDFIENFYNCFFKKQFKISWNKKQLVNVVDHFCSTSDFPTKESYDLPTILFTQKKPNCIFILFVENLGSDNRIVFLPIFHSPILDFCFNEPLFLNFCSVHKTNPDDNSAPSFSVFFSHRSNFIYENILFSKDIKLKHCCYFNDRHNSEILSVLHISAAEMIELWSKQEYSKSIQKLIAEFFRFISLYDFMERLCPFHLILIELFNYLLNVAEKYFDRFNQDNLFKDTPENREMLNEFNNNFSNLSFWVNDDFEISEKNQTIIQKYFTWIYKDDYQNIAYFALQLFYHLLKSFKKVFDNLFDQRLIINFKSFLIRIQNLYNSINMKKAKSNFLAEMCVNILYLKT